MVLEGTVLFQQANLEFKATTLNRMPSCETSKLFALFPSSFGGYLEF